MGLLIKFATPVVGGVCGGVTGISIDHQNGIRVCFYSSVHNEPFTFVCILLLDLP